MKPIYLLAPLLLTAPNLYAQSSTPIPASPISTDLRPRPEGPISLAQSIGIALKNSPTLRGAQAEIDLAAARIRAARAARKLSVSATTFLTTGSENGPIYNSPDGVMPQNFFAVPRGPFVNQNVMFMLPLFNGGRLGALARQAQSSGGAAGFDAQTSRLDVVLEVRTAYRQALLALELQNVARGRRAATAERLQNDRAALVAGRVPQLYVLRDEAEDADARQEVTNAARDAEMALVMLRAVMGAAPDSPISLADSLENLAAMDANSATGATVTALSATGLAGIGAATGSVAASPTAKSAETGFADLVRSDATATTPNTAIAAALAARPEVRAARARLQSARLGEVAARGSSRVQAALMGMGDLNRGRDGSAAGASVGVIFGVPILDGGLRRAGRESAQANVARAQADFDVLQIRVEREVQNAILTLNAAQINLATAQSGIDAAQEASRVAALRYEAGRATNAETLDALAALTRARANRARALFSAQVARDELERALAIGMAD